jgi:THO complex subunit 1
MKETIIEYLKSGSVEGAYYTRMVESVISRDKNWVRWKVESCPSIERPAISPAEYLSAKDAARKATASKRLRPKPMGSLDLAFLSEVDTGRGMEKLRSLSKHHLPALDSFKNKIALDDMEIEMPTNDESKEAAINGKASKSWRALRIASKIKLSSFDKIEDPERIDIIFDDEPLEADKLSTNEDTMDDEPAKYPTDRRPIVAAGLGGVGLGELLTMLVSRHPKVLGKSASHTVRPSQDGEVDGVHHYFVDQEKFNLMRDGDRFLEFGSRDGSDYGTSRKILDTMIAGGKVPIVETDFHGVQQLKDQSFPARYVFVEPPSLEELENRLRTNGEMSEERIKERLSAADDELKAAQDPGYYDKVIVNHEVEASYAELEDFIYESSASMESENAE